MAQVTVTERCCCRRGPPEAAVPTVAVAIPPAEVRAAPAFCLAAVGPEARPLAVVGVALIFRLAAEGEAIALPAVDLTAPRAVAVAAPQVAVVAALPGLRLTALVRTIGLIAGLTEETGMTLTGLTPIHPRMKRQRGGMLISSS